MLSYLQYEHDLTSVPGFPDSGTWVWGGHGMNTNLVYTASVGDAVMSQRVNELECSNICFVRGTKGWTLRDLQVMKSVLVCLACCVLNVI